LKSKPSVLFTLNAQLLQERCDRISHNIKFRQVIGRPGIKLYRHSRNISLALDKNRRISLNSVPVGCPKDERNLTTTPITGVSTDI